MDAKFLWGEVKCRANDFNAIYVLYETLEKAYYKSLVIDGQLLTISTDFADLSLIGDSSMKQFIAVGFSGAGKTLQKLLRMKELLKGCDFLVLKGDYKPLLFIRYYGEGTA